MTEPARESETPETPGTPSHPARAERLTETGVWHRLHPLSPVIRGGKALVPLVIVLSPTAVRRGSGDGGITHHLTDLIIAAVVIAIGVVSWLVTRWRIEGGALRIETGLLRRSSQRYPLSQVQAIDTVRPTLARAFGLAELRVRMGGSTHGHGRLAYLTNYDAEIVRGRLLALAHGMDADTAPPPERLLLTVPPGRLAASILISLPGGVTIAVLGGVIAGAVVAPDQLGAWIGGFVFPLFALATVSWRRFNGEYGMTVAEAPDGLRLRAGLLQTVAETIPSGRVQAVRLSEPLMWRPLGWCRLEVDVAGHERRAGEDSSVSHPLRAVLPVGRLEDARWLLERILPEAAAARAGAAAPPRRALWKAPLRYHFLSWGRTDTCVAATAGRVTRRTSWVPLAKVQSIRWTQGPVQRRLGLATVHLDTAGRAVRAALRDRGVAEAETVLGELIELSRRARRPMTTTGHGIRRA